MAEDKKGQEATQNKNSKEEANKAASTPPATNAGGDNGEQKPSDKELKAQEAAEAKAKKEKKDAEAKAKAEALAKAKEEERKNNPTIARQMAAKELREKNRKAAAKAAKTKEAKEEESKAKAEKKAKKKDNRPVYEDDRGLKFRFKKTAPKSLNIDGKSTPISDIIKNDEIMMELVYGNSNFIEQIYS